MEWALCDTVRCTLMAMKELPSAARVWQHLEAENCTRTFLEYVLADGQPGFRVTIEFEGHVIGVGVHATEELAGSQALLEAIQVMLPKESPDQLLRTVPPVRLISLPW